MEFLDLSEFWIYVSDLFSESWIYSIKKCPSLKRNWPQWFPMVPNFFSPVVGHPVQTIIFAGEVCILRKKNTILLVKHHKNIRFTVTGGQNKHHPIAKGWGWFMALGLPQYVMYISDYICISSCIIYIYIYVCIILYVYNLICVAYVSVYYQWYHNVYQRASFSMLYIYIYIYRSCLCRSVRVPSAPCSHSHKQSCI